MKKSRKILYGLILNYLVIALAAFLVNGCKKNQGSNPLPPDGQVQNVSRPDSFIYDYFLYDSLGREYYFMKKSNHPINFGDSVRLHNEALDFYYQGLKNPQCDYSKKFNW